jgi:hypothetical protein
LYPSGPAFEKGADALRLRFVLTKTIEADKIEEVFRFGLIPSPGRRNSVASLDEPIGKSHGR